MTNLPVKVSENKINLDIHLDQNRQSCRRKRGKYNARERQTPFFLYKIKMTKSPACRQREVIGICQR